MADIVWGDGTAPRAIDASQIAEHEYAFDGVYQIRVTDADNNTVTTIFEAIANIEAPAFTVNAQPESSIASAYLRSAANSPCLIIWE